MGRGRVVTWVGVAAAMAVAVLACRQLVGIGDDPPLGHGSTSNDAGAEAGFTYGQGACATCVATQCVAQGTACAGTPSCAALEGCMSGCGTDPTCRAQCGVDHSLGNDVATPAFEACLAGSCADACGLTCGGLAAVFPPATATACETCLAAKECAPLTACAVDPQCQTGLRCQFSSRTPDVLLACPTLAGYDAAAPSAPVFGIMPIGGSCSAECSWGADWSCVGHVDWPQVTSGPITMPLSVYDLATSAPVAGATARLCDVTDLPCGTPLDTQTTGTDGTTVMHRSPTQTLGLYYLDITSSALVPTLVFDTFNISRPQIVVHAGVFTPTDLGNAADLIHVTLDPALATLLVFAFDCRMAFAPDVVFHVEPPGSSQVFYVKGSFPSTTATATDTSGLAAIPNVAQLPQVLTVTAIPLALDGGVSSSVQAFTRDGGISNVYAVPTP